MPSAPHFEKISFFNSLQNPETEAKKLYEAMSELGFVIITDIPGFDENELLQLAKGFFHQKEDEKLKIGKNVFNSENKNCFRGFFPVIPGGHSLKEVFEIGGINSDEGGETKVRYTEGGQPYMNDIVEEPNVWPQFSNQSEQAAHFKATMQKYYDIYFDVAMQILRLFKRSLNIEQEFFDGMFEKENRNLATLRLIHYPPRDENNMHEGAREEDGAIVTTGAHIDTSMLTLLSTFQNGGLQVKYEGGWWDVPNCKDSLVMNIGELFMIMCENKLPATEHRVVDIGVDRFSAPFFLEPQFASRINISAYGKKIENLESHYGPWMIRRTTRFAEYKSTNFGVPVFD